MRIYYTNKKIFWNNETSDFLEKEKFDEYLGDDVWIEIRSNKSINWSSHYSASFYATDNFDATYFKVVKSNQTYYFFVDDIVFDSSSGKEYSLSLDLYNTYSIHLIEKLKRENPNVYFTRKHTNRYWKKDGNRVMNYLKQPWCFQIPQYLQDVENSLYPSNYQLLKCENQTAANMTWLKEQHGQWNDNPYEGTFGQYLYLRLKISPNTNSIIPLSPIVYYPVKPHSTTTDKIPNSYNKAITYSSDYVIDMCVLPIPPSSFSYGAKIKEFYSGESFANDESFILFTTLQGGGINANLKEHIQYIKPITNDDYNIDNLDNEIMLYAPQCYKVKVLDKDIPIPFRIDDGSYNDGWITFDRLNQTTISGQPFSSFYFNIGYGLLNNLYTPLSTITGDVKIPVIGNVYTSYLQNNGTSMSTEIALANEYKEIQNNYATHKGIGNIFGGFLEVGMGAITAIKSGGSMGLGAVGSGISSIVNAGIDMSYSYKVNEFNLKKTTSQQDALKADLKNQVGDMKDAYSKGQLIRNWSITTYELPQNEKLRVFTDIYFNGYITNTVFKFNDYDNRINFNYFELKNVFALCSQYLKLPKSIMTLIAKQLESGIRLWKTPNFDYTLNLDNREKSYEIN